MSTKVGNGEYTYAVAEGWGEIPEGYGEFGDVGNVGVDREDRVFVFNRSEHPMMVFDKDGKFLTSWGEGLYKRAHGVHMGPDDTIYLTDDGLHVVRKCTLEGKILLEIGIPDQPSGFMSGDPFSRCTHTALSPEGDIYVSDGYWNARVHKFSPEGKLLFSWGEPGVEPGNFNLPHNICCDADGWVYVADRENHRVQVFDGNGKFQTQLHNLHRPSALWITPGSNPTIYVGEIGPYFRFQHGAPNLGPRVSILSNDGEVLARLGNIPSGGVGPGQFMSPHGIDVDSSGDIYVGEVSLTAWPSLFPGEDMPVPIRALQKLVKTPA